jgi:hypothetical protein
MIDQFENSAVPFVGELAKNIKNQIRSQIQGLQGSAEHLDGYNRGRFLLGAQKLTGLELKRLQNYIDSLPRDQQGKITDPAYYMIGGDALHTFIKQETQRLRDQINKAEENQEELGKPEQQDIKPMPPPNLEKTTGLPRLGLEMPSLNEQLNKIKKLIQY